MCKHVKRSVTFVIFVLLPTLLMVSNGWCVSGILNSDEIWSGTVTVTGDVTVASGVTLTIEPGTVVKFDAQADDQSGGRDADVSELIVNGSLLAEGTEMAPILFTSDALFDNPGDWGGIRASWQLGVKTFSLNYCEIEYAADGLYFESSNGIHSLSISNSNFHDISTDGVYVYANSGAKLTFTMNNSTVRNTGRYGIYTYAYNNGSEIESQITGNTVQDTGNAGIYIRAYQYGAQNNGAVTGNTIQRASYYGIYGYSYNTDTLINVSDNDVSETQGNSSSYAGIYLTHSSSYTQWVTVTGNRVHNNANTTGIQISGNVVPDITLNEVYGNGYYGVSLGSSPADILYNDIHTNGYSGLYISSADGSNVNHNNIYNNGETYYAVQNVSGNSVNARYNWWGETVTTEMNAGSNPKNISRIYDVYDNASYGTVDYSGWLSAAVVLPTQGLSRITSPLDGAVLKTSVLRIQGIAVAQAGIDRVQVSMDNGATWMDATGTSSWSYDWTVPSSDQAVIYTVLSKVLDQDGVEQTPPAQISITIDPALPTTSGILTNDETWSGTVNLTGDVTVPDGVTLTIEPGTVVQALALNDDQGGGNDTSRVELIVNGVLFAQGTEASPIAFTSSSTNPASGDWAGIRLVPGANDADLIMSYCTVNYCRTGIDFQSSGYSADIVLDHCTMGYVEQDGVYVYANIGAKLTFTMSNSTVRNTGRYGIYTYAYSSGSEVDSQITDNTVQDTGNAGIYIQAAYYGTYGAQNDVTVTGNTIQRASHYGIYGYSYRTDMLINVSDNDVSETQGNSTSYAGIYLYHPSSYSYTQWATVTGNRVYNNASTTGIQIIGNVVPDITLNEVYGNGYYGINLDSSPGADIFYNDIHTNGHSGLYISSANGSNVNHNNIYGNGETDYAVQNVSGNSVNARCNWWGETVTAEMNAGSNPKNISRIYDVYDNASYGTVDYSGWLSAAVVLPTQGLSRITSPLDGAVLKTSVLRIQGIAVAQAGIDRVQVSMDNGATWMDATGTSSWSYDWTVPSSDQAVIYTVLSKVLDQDGVEQTPPAQISITIDPTLPTTSGTLTNDETWSGTVNLTGDVTVPDGVTLTIEPGTVVQALALNDDQGGGNDTSRIELIVNGVLFAQGTEASPIAFTSSSTNPASGDWAGIRLVPGANDADLIMSYCTVNYCRTGIDFQSSGYSADIVLDHCTMGYVEQDGVYVYANIGAKLTFTMSNSTVRNTGRYGIYTYAYSSGSEVDSQITDNTVQDTGNAGIYIQAAYYGTYGAQNDVTVTGNTIQRASHYGIYGYSYRTEHADQCVR